ncbi:MAG: hypothetical protein ACK478_09300 [Flavobacteriales bacterium]|jgi:hypothetical protein
MRALLNHIKLSSQQQSGGELLLSNAPFVLLLVQLLILLPEHNFLWGAENVFYRYGHADGMVSNAILRVYYAPEFSLPVIITHITCCLLALIPTSFAALPRAGAWLTALMLYAAAPSAYGWAMPMLLSSCFASIPLCLNGDFFDRMNLRYWLMIFLRVQSLLFVVGFVAMAWGNPQWQQGNAFYYAIHQDNRVRHWVLEHREGLASLSALFTYTTLLFATCFPALMFFRITRWTVLLISIIMLCTYALVFSDLMSALTLALLLLSWSIALPQGISKTRDFTAAN